jgi:hypothetical protein
VIVGLAPEVWAWIGAYYLVSFDDPVPEVGLRGVPADLDRGGRERHAVNLLRSAVGS